MTGESQQDQRATRRGVLLGVGLVGAAGALAGCSTAAVPYDANEEGQAPGDKAAAPAASSPMASGQAAGMAQGTGTTGTLLGLVKDIPVGGGVVFTDQKVVVTQPAKGVFKAFSAVCTHVGCICNKVANGTIDCPCHGSEFKIADGAVVAGPAPTPLPSRTITVTDGKIMLE
ncbi:MAG TPA: Rieske (2Fe-2S) protein [Trebonia sp.]|nr:Rieske (2Fe-2S) protein [Trebonia sp.]